MQWILSLPTTSWTAVTADSVRRLEMEGEFRGFLRPGSDHIVEGNWVNDRFLENQVYDFVIEDYLLGAVEGFAPYFQHNVFRRLRPHVGKALLLIGLEPYAEGPVVEDDVTSPA